ncbi:hypothetical protein [Streptomyces sp. NPDC056628]|uniref:hypothetical protein n=1 Tax=Streptomyces sp. NPDC056628 TaxID=3345882 RepID=UPI003685A8D1
MRPLLYLDVDGPLNPYAARPERRPEGYTTHRLRPEGWPARYGDTPTRRIKPLRVWLDPGHGGRLRELAGLYELVWATTWGAEANTFIAPVLGLPELPVVEWSGADGGRADGTFWKTGPLVAHARGRPFAWVDDELRAADQDFVAARHDAPALPHRVDARLGLREPDFAAPAAFAGDVGR